MKNSAMNTGHAFTRIILILFVPMGCYSQTCVNTYSPIVTKFVALGYNGQYTYVDQYGGAERYQNPSGRFLFKPSIESSYFFSEAVFGSVLMGQALTPDGGLTGGGGITSAAGLGVNYREKGSSSWITRLNGFNSNLISSVCTCNAGTTGDGTACTNCLEGTYKTLTGSADCLGCPANSSSPVASTVNTACRCNAGWTGNDGTACTNCLEGTYKTLTGSAACLGCPANSSSPVASTVIGACRCNAGYSGLQPGTCTLCPIGKHRFLKNNTIV